MKKYHNFNVEDTYVFYIIRFPDAVCLNLATLQNCLGSCISSSKISGTLLFLRSCFCVSIVGDEFHFV